MTSSIKGVEFHLSQLQQEVELFEQSCAFVGKTAVHQCYRLPEEEASQKANEVSSKLESAFRRVLNNIQATQAFVTSGEDIKEGYETEFLTLTEMDSKVRATFTSALDAMKEFDPTIEAKKKDILNENKTERATQIYVYYEGRGDLFVRGENAQMHMPAKRSASIVKPVDFGDCEEVSWERGLPLTPIADNLWSANLVAKEGQIPKLKYLVSDCQWSNGPDYQIQGEKTLMHIPPFGEHSCALLVPMDIGSGNKLTLFGEGVITIHGEQVELKWNQGVDFTCFGPNLWVLPANLLGKIECKISLVKQSGEKIWEEGPNRILEAGTETIANLKFPSGLGKIASMQVASSTLNASLLERQESIMKRAEEAQLQSQAQVRVRQFPTGSNNRGRLFRDEDIIRVADPENIEEIQVGKESFQFYRTKSHDDKIKHVLVQKTTKGCAAASVAMLIMDNQGVPNWENIMHSEGETCIESARLLREAKFNVVQTRVDSLGPVGCSIPHLRQKILENGPAILTILPNPKSGAGHAVIVDEISQDCSQIRMRDPWHGWDLVANAEAFRQAWQNAFKSGRDEAIVQIKNS